MANNHNEQGASTPDDEAPAIAASTTPPRLAVTGHGFLPGHAVTIRVMESDGTASFFRYTADTDGRLEAELPVAIPHGTLHLSATDNRPEPADASGVRWTNTETILW